MTGKKTAFRERPFRVLKTTKEAGRGLRARGVEI